jgi:hypothetical protein
LTRENEWRGFNELIMLVMEIQTNILVLRNIVDIAPSLAKQEG